MPGALDRYGDVFAALADPSRRIVLERLALAGESTATAIARGLPISRQAVVKHLTQLDRARLVESRRLGREVRYSVQPGQLVSAAQGIEAIAANWDRTLMALKRVAEETKPA